MLGLQKQLRLQSNLGLEALLGASAIPSWVVNLTNPPDLAFDFAYNRAWTRATGVQSTAAALLTVSRASVGYVNDSLGNWTAVNANLPRLSDLGLLVEEGRTNSIRNNSMQGAVAGTPGALPTNWVSVSFGGLSQQIVGTGTINGVDYIDYRIFGTSSGTSNRLAFDGSASIAATTGQVWSHSVFAAIVGGTTTNITGFFLLLDENTSGGALVNEQTTANLLGSLASNLTRLSQTITTAGGGTVAALQPRIGFNFTTASAIDVTLRIGWPQLENSALINATVASAVKAADGTTGVNGAAVYSVGGGTGTAATLNVTWAAGVMTVNSVASAGSYTVFPSSPATLTYVSGAATGWVGATVTLTPTNNAAQAFATSPIRTTSAAATRAADLATFATSITSAASAYGVGTREAPNALANDQVFVQIDDGTGNNRMGFRAQAASGSVYTPVTSAGSMVSLNTGIPWAANAKVAAAWANADDAIVINGGTVSAGVPTFPVGPLTTVRVGSVQGTSAMFNGFMSYLALWTSQRVPNAQLQSMTT